MLFHLSNEDYKLKPVVNAFQPRGGGGGGGGTPYHGLYGEAPPERGTFFRLELCERVGISRVQAPRKYMKGVPSMGSMQQGYLFYKKWYMKG